MAKDTEVMLYCSTSQLAFGLGTEFNLSYRSKKLLSNYTSITVIKMCPASSLTFFRCANGTPKRPQPGSGIPKASRKPHSGSLTLSSPISLDTTVTRTLDSSSWYRPSRRLISCLCPACHRDILLKEHVRVTTRCVCRRSKSCCSSRACRHA